MNTMDRPDVRDRLQQLDAARRHLAESMSASHASMQRTLDSVGIDTSDPWPRRYAPRWMIHRALPSLLVAIVVAAMIGVGGIVRWSRRGSTGSIPVVTVRTLPIPEDVPRARAPAGEPFLVRIHATRHCRVRITVDATVLDWRELKEGDELVSRPTGDILIEANDAGALTATVNGQSVRLGEDGRGVAFRFPPPKT
jgi:hypothetical protein